MHSMLSAIPGVVCLEPQGAFYCFPSFEGVLGRELGGRMVTTTLELAEVLLDVAKVAIVPGEAFGAPGYARLSFALGDDDLEVGIRRIAEFLGLNEECAVEQSCSGHRRTRRARPRPHARRRARGRRPARTLARRADRRGPGRGGLVIRSATQVTAEVLAAGTDLVVVGRAGIGLDNVDVAAATERGVMVVNAPQSNVISAAEQTVALLLAQARNIPQADRDLKAGKWNRSRWTGVELHGKTLGVVGLGRVGVLVAQRCLAFGMRLVAYDPYVSAERARQLGVELQPDLGVLVESADFLTIHLPKTPETIGLFDAELLAHAKPGLRIVNTARGGIIDEAALADALAHGPLGGAAIDVFAIEPTTESPLFALENVVVTPHLGASTSEAQDKAGQTIAEMVVLGLAGEFVPFAVNLAASEANATVAPFLPLVERLGRLFTGLAGGVVDTLEVSYEGQIADYDCKVLTLAALKGVLGPVVDEPVSFVNAPAIAASRGLEVKESKLAATHDYVNLVELRGSYGGRATHVAGTLYGKQGSLAHRRDRRPRDRRAAVGAHARGAQLGCARDHRQGRDDSRRRVDQHRRHGRRPDRLRSGRAHGPVDLDPGHRHRPRRVARRGRHHSTPRPSNSAESDQAERCVLQQVADLREDLALDGERLGLFFLRAAHALHLLERLMIRNSTNAMMRKFTSTVRKLP